MSFYLVCIYQHVLLDFVHHPPQIRLKLCLPLFPGQWEIMIILKTDSILSIVGLSHFEKEM